MKKLLSLSVLLLLSCTNKENIIVKKNDYTLDSIKIKNHIFYIIEGNNTTLRYGSAIHSPECEKIDNREN